MPCSEFYDRLRQSSVRADAPGVFASWPDVIAGPMLTDTLAETLPLAVAISTEKTRSELIIVPVLLEARRRAHRPVSLFSGIEFAVDSAQGLTGECDAILLDPTEYHISDLGGVVGALVGMVGPAADARSFS